MHDLVIFLQSYNNNWSVAKKISLFSQSLFDRSWMVASFTTSYVYTRQVLDGVVASLNTSWVHIDQVLDGVMLLVASLPSIVCILDINMITFMLFYTVTPCRYIDCIFHNNNQSHIYSLFKPFLLCTHSNLLILCLVHNCICLIACVHYIDKTFNTRVYQKQTVCLSCAMVDH